MMIVFAEKQQGKKEILLKNYIFFHAVSPRNTQFTVLPFSPRRPEVRNLLFFSQCRSQFLFFTYAESRFSYETRHKKTSFFEYAKTKTQISFEVTAKLISALKKCFRYTDSTIPLLSNILNPKFQASSHLQWQGRPGLKPRKHFLTMRLICHGSINVIRCIK